MNGFQFQAIKDFISSQDRRREWQELAIHFLESYNPKLDKEVVVMNAIMDYDGPIPERPTVMRAGMTPPIQGNTPEKLRYHAHEFVSLAVGSIEHNRQLDPESSSMSAWLAWWSKNYGVE